MQAVATANPKNYQLWNHRRRLALALGPEHEEAEQVRRPAGWVLMLPCCCGLRRCFCSRPCAHGTPKPPTHCSPRRSWRLLRPA